MSILSSLFKKKKPSLTPDVTPLMPSQINPKQYNSLQDLSLKYQAGPGFGDDFMSKTSNPSIKASTDYFNDYTMPKLSSALSARGVNRSVGPGLASDVISRAGKEQQNYVDEILAQNYRLNEIQKKNDVQFGANLGQNILSGDVQAQQHQASASERLANATAAQQMGFYNQDRQMAGNLVTAGAQLFAPNLSKAFEAPQPNSVNSSLSQLGVPSVSGSISPVATRTIDSVPSSSLDAMSIQQLLMLFGG